MNRNYLKNYYGETVANLLGSYKGLGYTMSTDGGSTEVFAGPNKLLQDIRFKLLTPRGSMLTVPEYGSNIYKYRYRALVQPTYDSITEEVKRVLSTFPGVSIGDVSVNGDNENNTIKISYLIYYNSKELTDSLVISVEG